MGMIDSVLAELDREAKTTERVFERIPEDKLGWRPHEKSMSLGQLALHIANTPGAISAMAIPDTFEIRPSAFKERPVPANRTEVFETYRQGLAAAKESLSKLDDATLMATWQLTQDGKPLMAVPRIGFLRSIMLNHSYHHRGQLSVYLRLLNVPVPSIYGPSADESPFG